MTPMENVKRAVDAFNEIINYANFLKQPLTLGMFVPCDEDGNVLGKEPNEDELCKFCDYPGDKRHTNAHSLGCEGSRCESTADNYTYEYNQSKERILFEGFEVDRANELYLFYNIIEDLLTEDLTLTESAIKQLGL
jgi:hypothetical protein